MSEVRISLVGTVKDEASSIDEFLETLLSQSRPPDESIIVDGGSTDGTLEKLKFFAAKRNFPTKVLVRPGTNIAQALNIAIQHAKHDLIASTAAGCTYDKNWLENLIKPFERDLSVKVVAGWYKADARSPFEHAVAEMTTPKLSNVDPNEFLPAFRSMAFHRSAWEAVEGIPEWLTFAADDTLFDIKLKKAGFKFHFAPDAVCYWRMQGTYKGLWKQYYRYARGDGEANIFTQRYISLLKKYVIGIFLLGLGFWHWLFWVALILGFLYYISRRLAMKKPDHSIRESLRMVLTIDIAQVLGWMKGRWNRFRGIKEPGH